MKTIQLSVLPEESYNQTFLKHKINQALKEEDFEFSIVKRSIDARKKLIKINLKIDVYFKGETPPKAYQEKFYKKCIKR